MLETILDYQVASLVRLTLIRLFVSRNLMAKDEFKNLGFAEEEKPAETKKAAEGDIEKGVLRW
jgi:hypothetical protein